jgi:anti-sigma B factor antagonist
MEIKVNKHEKATVLSVFGKLTAVQFSESLRGKVKEELAAGATCLLIDLKELEHIDSTGVGELVAAFSSAQHEDAEFYLVRLSDQVQEILEMTNLSDVFDVLDHNDPEVAPLLP